MSDRQAVIIPFPIRSGRSGQATVDGGARLEMALAKLDLALAEQQLAMENWRAALGALKLSASSLEAGLGRYHDVLGALGKQVDGLGATARQLEDWADSVEAGTLS